MRITINDQDIDYTIGEERTVGEVVRSLRDWLSTGALLITRLSLDERPLSLDPGPDWSSLPLESAGRLDVAARTAHEIRTESLQALADYASLADAALLEGNTAVLSELAQSAPAVARALYELVASAPGPEPTAAAGRLAARLEESLRDLAAAAEEEAAERIASRRAALAEVRTVLLALFRRETDPLGLLAALAGELRASAREIGEVSVLLQTGNDRAAMASVARVSALLQEALGVLPYARRTFPEGIGRALVGGKPLEEYCAEINPILSELVEAFAARDSVLMGDLLEYEVAPRVKDLAECLGNLGPSPGGA